MGRQQLGIRYGSLFHVIFRGVHPDTLVENDEDWKALGRIVERMLWWCGGLIHACRCEGNEMHFALQAARAPVGAMCRRIATGFALHVRGRRALPGRIFAPYVAIPVDGALYLDDLVVWLHRPCERRRSGGSGTASCHTGDAAYLDPRALTWINTKAVLDVFGRGEAAVQIYRKRRIQGVDPDIVILLNRPAPSARGVFAGRALESRGERMPRPLPNEDWIRKLAHRVADHLGVSYETLCSRSLRREVTRARVLVAVLAVRSGASVAAAARVLGGLDRSTLIAEAEPYRLREPQLFEHAEVVIAPLLDAASGR